MYAVIKRTIIRELLPITTLTVSLFVFTVLVRYTIFPDWQRGAAVRREVAMYKALIRKGTEYEELKSAIRAKQTLLEKKHTELTQGLADPHDLSGLLQMIFDKAWEADIRFDKTIPQPETRGADYVHYPVLLEMTTSYMNLGKFISSLERIPQIVRVDRIAITAQDEGKVSAMVMITCYLSLQ